MGGETGKSLMRLKIADLRARCAEKGLDESGTKADLVGRLLKQSSDGEGDAPSAAAEEKERALEASTKDDGDDD